MHAEARPRSRVGVAYACFGWIAAVPWIGPAASLLPSGVEQLIVTPLSVPIVLGTLAAGSIGVGVAFLDWREWPLLVLAAVSLGMFALFLAVDGFEVVARE